MIGPLRRLYYLTWWDLHLSVRTRNCLLNEGIKNDQDLINFFGRHGKYARKALLRIPNVGRVTADEIIRYVKHIIHNPDDVAWQGKRVR